MNWFYVEAGQQAGPVDDAQLEELRRSGKIQSDTLVWREGMANWQPYSSLNPASPPASTPIPAAAPAVGPNQVVCAECGRIFDLENTIQYGTIRVCANCKPVFMQKLAEGAKVEGAGLNYAGFWIR